MMPCEGDLDMLSLAERFTTLRRDGATNGGEWHGPCPACGGNDRLIVWPYRVGDGPRWLCRKSEGHTIRGGGPLAFVMVACGYNVRQACDYLGIDYATALRELRASRGGGDWTAARQSRPASLAPHEAPRPAPHPVVRPAWADAAETLLPQWEAALWSPAGARARAVLQRRGLNEESIRAWRLGYHAAGSLERPAYVPALGCRLERGIVIPLCGPDGLLYGLDVRRPLLPRPAHVTDEYIAAQSEAEQRRLCRRYVIRYMAARGSTRPLMLHSVGATELVVCEGELDAMLAAQLLPDFDVATLGGSGGRPDAWLAWLVGYRRIWVVYDADAAGDEGWRRQWRWLPNARRVHLPLAPGEGKDLTDYVTRGGDLAAWVELCREADASSASAERTTAASAISAASAAPPPPPPAEPAHVEEMDLSAIDAFMAPSDLETMGRLRAA